MNYSECIINARTCIGKYCKACPECNGRACTNRIPGPGAKGVRSYIEKIGSELEDTMKMCGISCLDDITEDCVFI